MTAYLSSLVSDCFTWCSAVLGPICLHDRPQSSISRPAPRHGAISDPAGRIRERNYVCRLVSLGVLPTEFFQLHADSLVYRPFEPWPLRYLCSCPILDGAGLFCSVLKHLSARGPACPKVLAATHFHDVFTGDLLDPASMPITFLHMQILLTSSSGHLIAESPDDEDTEGERRIAPGERITYLYR